MAWVWRAVVLAALLVVVSVILVRKTGPAEGPADAGQSLARDARAPGVPRLVDVGADRCIPCKAMAPILQELRTEYAGRMRVEFIDLWKNPDAADPYRVHLIPTQIFYAADGRELERHEGFISKADILATWRRHGYDFASPRPATFPN